MTNRAPGARPAGPTFQALQEGISEYCSPSKEIWSSSPTIYACGTSMPTSSATIATPSCLPVTLRSWCMLCRKWLATGLVKIIGNPAKLFLISDEGLDLNEHRLKCERSRHNPKRVFIRHKETTIHKDSLALEKSNIQLGSMWNLKSRSDTKVMELLHKLLYRLKKEHLS